MVSCVMSQIVEDIGSEVKNSESEKMDAGQPGDLPELDDPSSSTSKPDVARKSNYSDPRFASLFSKSRRQFPSRILSPKHTTRVKPTLPSFIRNAPTNRVTTEATTTKSSRIVRTTPKPKLPPRTTTSPSSRSSNNNRNNRQRDSVNAVTTESPKKNRRFGDSSYSPRNSTRTRTSRN